MASSSTSVLSNIGAHFSYSPSSINAKIARAQRPNLGNQKSRLVVVKAAEGGINLEIRKNEPKVVDNVLVSELSKPLTAYCRCWRSGTFPLCDGSHVKHNKATGDNVNLGRLLLSLRPWDRLIDELPFELSRMPLPSSMKDMFRVDLPLDMGLVVDYEPLISFPDFIQARPKLRIDWQG